MRQSLMLAALQALGTENLGVLPNKTVEILLQGQLSATAGRANTGLHGPR